MDVSNRKSQIGNRKSSDYSSCLLSPRAKMLAT